MGFIAVIDHKKFYTRCYDIHYAIYSHTMTVIVKISAFWPDRNWAGL